MTPASDPSLDAMLRAVRTQFALGLPDKAAHVVSLMAGQDWAGARLAAHKLRGSAAAYGFARIGAVAAEMEDLLLEAQGAPGENERERLSRLGRDMTDEAARAQPAAEPPS